MKSENIIQQKSFAFAIRIVKTHKFLIEEKREFILSKQMMRSGTSVGANVEESKLRRSVGSLEKYKSLWKRELRGGKLRMAELRITNEGITKGGNYELRMEKLRMRVANGISFCNS